MRKKMVFLPLLVLFGVLAALAGRHFIGSRPFRDLRDGEIVSASVQLMPPDVTLTLTADECRALEGLLREVVIYERDSSWNSYCGQAVVYTAALADGTERTVYAYNPFLIIDGIGYRTKYKPCEALSRFANVTLSDARKAQ